MVLPLDSQGNEIGFDDWVYIIKRERWGGPYKVIDVEETDENPNNVRVRRQGSNIKEWVLPQDLLVIDDPEDRVYYSGRARRWMSSKRR